MLQLPNFLLSISRAACREPARSLVLGRLKKSNNLYHMPASPDSRACYNIDISFRAIWVPHTVLPIFWTQIVHSGSNSSCKNRFVVGALILSQICSWIANWVKCRSGTKEIKVQLPGAQWVSSSVGPRARPNVPLPHVGVW